MTIKNKYINITVSLIALLVILLFALKFCGKSISYTKAEVDRINEANAIKQHAYEDSILFVRAKLDIATNVINGHEATIVFLEKKIDSITAKHAVTKNKLQPSIQGDTNMILAPLEYVNECEDCFTTLAKYQNANKQLRFERDAYDSLQRQQSNIQNDRITELRQQTIKFNKMLNDCLLKNESVVNKQDITRKLKLSLIGGSLNQYLPNVYGAGLIYEDKKFNDFGIHVANAGKLGSLVIFNFAKTISFRNKK